MPQALHRTGQHRPVVAGLDIDHPAGGKAGRGQRPRKEVGPRDAPERLAFRMRGDAGGEERGHGAVARPIAAAGDLMPGAKRQPAAGEAGVHLGDIQGKRRGEAAARWIAALTANVVVALP